MSTVTAQKVAFRRYTEWDPAVPVWCITPGLDRCIHRFFDTSPVSPSGRYVGLTRLPFEDRLPGPGDTAQIVVVDLSEGTEQVVAESRGWDTQLGAQVQWGADDTCLVYNDMDPSDWRPYGVILDPFTKDSRRFEHGVYMVSPDGRNAAAPCLLRTARTQAGYGVLVPDTALPRNAGAPADDGVWVTDLASGRSRLVVSLREIVETALDPDEYTGGTFYGFHVKWNPQGTRLMLVLRCLFPAGSPIGRKNNVITMNADGSGIRVAIPASEWGKGGHHPNWCPDGERVLMNIKYHGDEGGMRFVTARYDGSEYGMLTDAVRGSGHPTLHPGGRHILTDAYVGEPVSFGDGTTPIRWVDLREGTERALVRINSVPDYKGVKNELRVDPHPAWDRRYERIVFNAYLGGTRRVLLADLSELIGNR